MTGPEVSIVVPAFNESLRIGPSLDRIAEYFGGSGVPYEVIVVDDGSSDDTAAVARGRGARVVSFERNRGKGAAVRAGVLASRGETILFTDADLSTPIDQFCPFREKLLEGYDVVVGSRAIAGARLELRQPWYRETMGKCFNRILRLVLPLELRDSQCGFKLFRAAPARRLFEAARIDGFAFDAEILFLAGRFGYRVAEIPVPWFNSLPSRVDPLRHSLQMLRDLLRIRFYQLFNAYAGPEPDGDGP
ncbi:MAG TPA: dolichyl-phosphate beta-glucosyltransferase [Vicinamibacteria bacterium]|jgi:dolichyl-phosphate beta-glucosyltransferase